MSLEQAYPFLFFRITPEEAEIYALELVAVYNEVYNGTYPVEECTDPDKIREILEKQRHIWWVAIDRENNRIASTGVGLPNPWNKSFESCRIVTHPTYSGSMYHLAELLYRMCLEDILRQEKSDITFAYLRTKGMIGIMKSGHYPITVVGSDLGKHIVREKREIHPIGMLVNPLRDDITRVELPKGRFDHYDFVQSEILHATEDPLVFPHTIEGEYPPHVLVGPKLANRFDSQCVSLEYGCIPRSKSIEIRGVVPNCSSLHPTQLAAAVNQFIESFEDPIGYLSLYLLADKSEHREALRDNGFQVAAYLPGWFELGGLRYDALKMARRLDENEPVCFGTEEYIEKFTQGLNH